MRFPIPQLLPTCVPCNSNLAPLPLPLQNNPTLTYSPSSLLTLHLPDCVTSLSLYIDSLHPLIKLLFPGPGSLITSVCRMERSLPLSDDLFIIFLSPAPSVNTEDELLVSLLDSARLLLDLARLCQTSLCSTVLLLPKATAQLGTTRFVRLS
ncbi:hypothetical protein M758_5G182100 [Ceratodon purpureus]|uniref:Uncharacterized protein n=1 Tax=Ceratodon purpureus TaxID=3225 RepID=A0A8T0I357_CERPU|nr:hypothetical protein KC19_5G189500 [Ceratodon purpureus]KAG0617333.1 hypothetical protein M758_5G182100 [Ceratodon purpureus]